MSSLLQSSVGLLKSRLSRRIVSWIFLSIVTIEVAIFIPAYARRRGERLRGLESVSQEVLFTIKNNVMADMAPKNLISSGLSSLSPDSVILGAALYDTAGNLLDSFGEQPTLPAAAAKTSTASQLVAQGTRYDVAWPPERFQGRYILVIRHDATSVKAHMRIYAVTIALLVILISAFVTLVMILGLERLLINPLLDLRNDLSLAAAAIKRGETPKFRSLALPRQDELGDVALAFGDMFDRITEEIQERQAAEAALRTEQEKSELLLLNILPPTIAAQLKDNQGAIASRFESVTILFADIVGFTALAAQTPPVELVRQLNQVFSAFDALADALGLEKIKTIGDAYMVVGGLPEPLPNHAERVVQMAVQMQDALKQLCHDDGPCFHLRIGIHTGPVVAGVIGLKKFSYDLWGDTVNIASRLESHGLIDHIQVSEATYKALQHAPGSTFKFADRGCITLKGRGEMRAYLLEQSAFSSGPSPVPPA